MSSSKNEDNSDTIVKSIKPLNYKFSSQSHQYDKYFKKLGFGSIENNFKKKRNNKNNFQSSLLYKNIDSNYNIGDYYIDYFEDLNGEKKMPIKVDDINSPNYVKNLYNPEFEKKTDDLLIKNEEKKFNFINEYKCKNVIRLPDYALDPGYYNPNYNAIKKRIPCIDFSKSYDSHNNIKLHKSIDEKNEENNNESNIKLFYNELNKIEDYMSDKISFEDFNIKDTNIKMENQLIKLNLKQNLNFNKKNNINSNFGTYMMKSRNLNSNEDNKIISTKMTMLPKIKLNNINKKENYKYNLKKVSSTPNIISFKKMRGRDDKNIKKNITKDIYYKINYESTSPHVPGFVFKPSDIKIDYKKYKLGKILRSYVFDPYKYFVMDINQNKSTINLKHNNKKKEIDDTTINEYIKNKSRH